MSRRRRRRLAAVADQEDVNLGFSTTSVTDLQPDSVLSQHRSNKLTISSNGHPSSFRASPCRFTIFILVCLFSIELTLAADSNVEAKTVQSWASIFGQELYAVTSHLTDLKGILANFRKLKDRNISPVDYSIVHKDGENLLKEMNEDVKNFLYSKTEAVLRIADQAQDFEITDITRGLKHKYHNVEDVNSYVINEETSSSGDLPAWRLKHFNDIPVMLNHSTVQLPSSVSDRDDEVINAIKWSQQLGNLFVSNYELDPTLTWQYFASFTGFIRQYPGVKWESKDSRNYDARMRNWYLQAASSMKDVVILVDSASMVGSHKKMITLIVDHILETLTVNDFFSVISYSNIAESLLQCNKENLLQATVDNIKTFRSHLNTLPFDNIKGNISIGLNKAFRLLSKSGKTESTSSCNKAIIVVTSQTLSSHLSTLGTFKWPKNTSVNVFSYIYAKNYADNGKKSWQYCGKNGYVSKIGQASDIKEQVLKYIEVLSWPDVVSAAGPVLWTNVYADIIDTKDHFKILKGLEFMTTVSAPVRVMKKKNRGKSIGVAAADVPISEIRKLLTPHKLGVNGYAFAITNNGDVLFHPNHQPMFHNLVKPSFNNVDLAEVESVQLDENDSKVDEVAPSLQKLRKFMIDRETNDMMMRVNVHYDNMQRVSARTNRYYVEPIKETPFSIGIALPRLYGDNKIVGKIKITQSSANNYMIYLRGNWTLHPNWVYCQYRNHSEARDPKKLLLDLIHRDEVLGDKHFWKNMVRVKPALKYMTRSGSRTSLYSSIYCDRELIESMVFDAQQSDTFDKASDDKYNDDDDPLYFLLAKQSPHIRRTFGVTSTFVGTRSGFTRFRTYNDDGNEHGSSVDKIPERTIDELYYKQAVDFHFFNSTAFAFTVPSDASKRKSDDIRVTGSFAIFPEVNGLTAPWGVVGINMKHSKLSAKFFNITSERRTNTLMDCSSKYYKCYLLDNNGYVVVSSDYSDTGKLFAEIDVNLMIALLKYDIYRKVTIYDYQGVCQPIDTKSISDKSSANFIFTPLNHLNSMVKLLWGKMLLWMIDMNFYGWLVDASSSSSSFEYFRELEIPESTRPRRCNKEINLYRYGEVAHKGPINGKMSQCHASKCGRSFGVAFVPKTNLLLMVVDVQCPCVPFTMVHKQKEVDDSMLDFKCPRRKLNLYRSPLSQKCVLSSPQRKESSVCDGVTSQHVINHILYFFLPIFHVLATASIIFDR